MEENNKPYDLEPNVEAALAYFIPPFTGIIIYVFEKKNKFVRFHALQSILFGIAAVFLSSIAGASLFIIFGGLIASVVSFGLGLTWLFLMWKAYSNEEYELPMIGKIARDQLKS